MATTLPFDVFNDNFTLWESSDPTVCKVNYGVLEGLSEGNVTITAYDADKKFSDSFEVRVINPEETLINEEETFDVVLSDYGIFGDNTNSSETTTGIQQALDFAYANGFKKIVFPYGEYLVNPEFGTIHLPSDTVIDFSDSIINIEPSSLTSTGYDMISMDEVENTRLIRAHVFGEADFTSSAESTEGCQTLTIIDAYKSGVDQCTFSKSPGFNVQSMTRLRKTGTTDCPVPVDSYEVGNIDDLGNNDDTVIQNHFRSNEFLDISGLGNYYLLGYTQGYFGYAHVRSRLYTAFFYDSNYNLLEVQKYNHQFYKYDTPIGAKYAKIVIYQEAIPTTQDNDFNATVFFRTPGMARDCFITNTTFEDNFSTGLAMSGGQDWLIKGNNFNNNSVRTPACDIDWEDGWETMVGDVVKNNSFNSDKGVILSAGASTALFDNDFNQSFLKVYGRTQNFRIFSNNFFGPMILVNDLVAQAESYFARNVFDNCSYSLSKQHEGASYRINDLNNTIV